MELDLIDKNVHRRENLTFYYQKPDDLPEGYLDKICKLVEAGGSVDTKFVRYNLEKAYLIAYVMDDGVIVGNSSLKHPRKEFITKINKIINFDFTGFLERGYTSVKPEYRAFGIGTKLLGGLTARAENYKIFSIISEDNKATQKIALRNNTKKIANYYSEKVGKEMGVWMPEHMIEKRWGLKL
jgi:GNAT superfamily N-acetyltransferase